MKKEGTKMQQQIGLFFLLLISTVSIVNAQYTLTDNDVVVTDGVIQSCSYDFAVTDIIIPATLDGQTVTGIRNGSNISDGVFYNKGITTLQLPAGLTHLGDYAFIVNSLTEITLPSGLTYMGKIAFNNNQIITVNGASSTGIFYARNVDATVDSATIVSYGGTSANVVIPAQVEIINDLAFSGGSYSNLDFSACTSLTVIGTNAFNTTSALTSLDLSSCTALTTIEQYAFYGNSIENVNLNACTSLTSIGNSAFRDNEISTLDLTGCTVLASIGQFAFLTNVLTEVNLPDSITQIGFAAFNDNQISMVNGSSTDGIFYARNADASVDNTTIVSYGGVSKDVNIPAQVLNLEPYAFAYNSLTSVNLSACSALTDINNNCFSYNSFNNIDLSGCTALTTIWMQAFSYGSLSSVNLNGCSSLTTIKDNAFSYNSITSIDLSTCTALTDIGHLVFYSNLMTEFTLPTPSLTCFIFNYWIDGNSNQYEGGATVSDLYTNYTADLSLSCFEVAFNITDGITPIEGAVVQLDGYGTVICDASGSAIFSEVTPENDIAYTVSATGYESVNGTVSVVGSNLEENVNLIALGLKDLFNQKIKIYPNPATDILTITGPAESLITRLKLYNILGQEINIEPVMNKQKMIMLNMQELEKGSYILILFTNSNQVFSKIIQKE